MRAIVISETGGPDVMTWTEVSEPAPGPGQVVVAVAAAGLNYIDTYHRTGLYPLPLPFTPGLEGAGKVTAVGDGVEVSVGDHVAWSNGLGTYAEQVLLDASQVVPVPEGIEMEIAAAVMLQGLTAHYLAHSTYPLQPGDQCLIHAGAGGVGLLLIQMAKKAGAEVFTTVSTDEKAELAAAAGADHVINYREQDFKKEVERIAGPQALAVVYDGVGATTFDDGLELLRTRGTMALFGQSSGVVPPFNLARLGGARSLYVTRPSLFAYVATRDELLSRSHDVLGWVSDGSLDVRIGQRFALADASAAHAAIEGRSTTGKTLLLPEA